MGLHSSLMGQNFYFYCFRDSSPTSWFFMTGSLILLILRRDSSFTIFNRGFVLNVMDCPWFSLLWFIHCLRADSSALITGDLSPLL